MKSPKNKNLIDFNLEVQDAASEEAQGVWGLDRLQISAWDRPFREGAEYSLEEQFIQAAINTVASICNICNYVQL